jgi:GWxTD domain-containing protein
MRTNSLIRFGLTIALLLAGSAGASAQEGSQEKTIVPMKGGYFVLFTTTPGPSPKSADGWSMTFAEAYFKSNTIRRVFIDSGGSLYFGYAIVIEPIASTKQFRVSVRSLSPEDEQDLKARKSFQTRQIHPNYNAAGLSRASAPQIIEDGDSFALDVLVNPRTGDKITDFVTVSASETNLRAAPTAESAPRDFTLEDVMMKMINYQLFINDELVAGGKRSGAAAGPIIWFHLQERGRFIFSLKPHEGYDFQKLGTIERNRLKFTLNNERYEWVSDTPVVDSGGPWNLYVLYDPNYVPDSFFLGVNGAAKGENRTSSASRYDELVAAYPASKRVRARGFGKTPDASKQEDAPDKAPGARLIIGAASRVENLLPVNTGHLAQPGLGGNYSRWIYEDAVYLITQEEALAFKQLRTDGQREAFIEQFWQRRDPDPRTPENEYRREHYARFAYANENFSFGDVPGWRTDRGRIFILHGKPDGVETIPPGEKWLYKNIPGLGVNVLMEFVDFNGKGDFRLNRPDLKP